MGAPRKAHNLQSVKIRSTQRLTTSAEPNIERQEVTNVVKPVNGTYKAATQVKVLSPETVNIVEADVLHYTEGSMKRNEMVSYFSLYRGLSPWHGTRWKLCELGRSSVFPRGYTGTSQQRQGPVDDAEEVGLIDSTRSLGKPSTWGSDQQYCDSLGTYRSNTRRLE